MKTLHERQGDTVVKITIDTNPAHITWEEVLDAVKIEPDDDQETPWEYCDGFDHELVAVETDDDPNSFFDGRRRRVVVRVDYDTDLYKYYRNQGASRGVADQLTRQTMARTREQITAWYRNGWEWWVVVGKLHDCHASVGGIDSYEYAEEMRAEIADELADELEKIGYTITGKPQVETATHKRPRGNVNLFNWQSA